MDGLSLVAEKEGASNAATCQYQMSVDAAQSYSRPTNFFCVAVFFLKDEGD